MRVTSLKYISKYCHKRDADLLCVSAAAVKSAVMTRVRGRDSLAILHGVKRDTRKEQSIVMK